MGRRIKKFNSEENLHQQVVEYIRRQYPGVLFRTDFAAGIKMTQGQANKHKSLQAGRAWPDLFIATSMPRKDKPDFNGLFIELKKEGTKLKREVDAKKIRKGETILRLAGDWWDQHIEEQAAVLQLLGMNGYCVMFCVGFDDTKKAIDRYLAGNNLAKQTSPNDDKEVF